jgi:pseudouridine-5'-phosphate glycosidase
MQSPLPASLVFSPEVARARRLNLPMLALESAVITHGLPHPKNLELALAVEEETREAGVTPATIAVLGGKLRIGLSAQELDRLASMASDRKVSRRDFGIALARGQNGGTTVAGTLIAASLAGIRVFATGGIGGVHRDAPYDVSADLPELARQPVLVVCAGAKAILDLRATVEYLETAGVPIIGYRTPDFPAFYARRSGLPVDVMVDTPAEAVEIATRHWELGLSSAVLVVQPPPEDEALNEGEMEGVIQQALVDARQLGVRGSAVTPYLLARVSQLTEGESLRANLALLRSNVRLGAAIAAHFPRNDAQSI